MRRETRLTMFSALLFCAFREPVRFRGAHLGIAQAVPVCREDGAQELADMLSLFPRGPKGIHYSICAVSPGLV